MTDSSHSFEADGKRITVTVEDADGSESAPQTVRRSVFDIQRKINDRTAKVYTAKEFKDLVRQGKRPTLEQVDAVTAGTFGIVSGTMAIFCIPVCEAGRFKHAEKVTVNGVPATVGPCPNESLGMVDIIVNGTARRDRDYGGGHLFRDLVEGKNVEVLVETDAGDTISRMVTLGEIPFARMVTTRSFFKNYNCFATPEEDVETIFCGPNPMKGGWAEATFSGCGDISPLQNDPDLRFLRTGAGVFVNGAPGIVLGTGTRSNAAKPNLSVQADMHQMRPEYMGGFRTSISPECTISVGTVFPVLDQDMLERLSILNEDVELPLNDVRDRKPICLDYYSSVWNDGNIDVKADTSRCLHCKHCIADEFCPRDASPSKGIDRSLCMECGNCVNHCVGHVFSCDMGKVRFEIDPSVPGGQKKTFRIPVGQREEFDVPIGQRQSCRRIGLKVCDELKQLVEDGKWSLGYFNEYIQ